jgi:hypothetical protein
VRDNPNTPSAEQILKAHQTVYLFKWLFPESVIEKHLKKTNKGGPVKQTSLFQTFKNNFVPNSIKQGAKENYWSRFEDIDRLLQDDDDDEDEYQSESDYKESEDEADE